MDDETSNRARGSEDIYMQRLITTTAFAVAFLQIVAATLVFLSIAPGGAQPAPTGHSDHVPMAQHDHHAK
jgi:hypothetical protein